MEILTCRTAWAVVGYSDIARKIQITKITYKHEATKRSPNEGVGQLYDPKRDMKSVDLMEEAAKAVADFIQNEYTDHEKPIVVFSGPGNNGGDGLAMARMLSKRGYKRIQAFCLIPTIR